MLLQTDSDKPEGTSESINPTPVSEHGEDNSLGYTGMVCVVDVQVLQHTGKKSHFVTRTHSITDEKQPTQFSSIAQRNRVRDGGSVCCLYTWPCMLLLQECVTSQKIKCSHLQTGYHTVLK